MEVDTIIEGLDHGPDSLHKLKACGCVQEVEKRTHRRETKIGAFANNADQARCLNKEKNRQVDNY